MRKIILLLLIISWIEYGCSINVQLYLRNLTNKSAKVTVLLSRPRAEEKFLYSEGVIDPKYNLKKSFSKDLVPLDSSRLRRTFEIPPNSTSYFGQGTNFRFNVKEMYIDCGGRIDTLKIENSDLLQLKKGVAWYDMK